MHWLSSVSVWINNWRAADERGIGPYQDMDTISMLLTGWVIFIFIAIALVKYIYWRFVKKTSFPEFESLVAASQQQQQQMCFPSNEQPSGTTTIIAANIKSDPKPPVRRKRIDKSAESFDEITAATTLGPCTGPDPVVVDFVNKVYDWAFKEGSRGWEDVKDNFITAVNKSLKDGEEEEQLKISVLNYALKDQVKLSNIFAECNHPNNVKVTADCELQAHGHATVLPKEGEMKRVQFFVDRISGRFSTLFDCEDKTAVVKLDGWPEICVGISASAAVEMDQKMTELIGARIASAIRNTVVELDYSKSEGFPNSGKYSPMRRKRHSRQLLVKVVRGKDLTLSKELKKEGGEVPELYCSMELNDPPQKFQTDAVRSQNPVWNENFVISIHPSTGELMFEVYDKIGPKLLGCNIVSVDEIVDGKTQLLPLKSREMDSAEQSSGLLELQFNLVNEHDSGAASTSSGKKSAQQVKTKRSVFTRSPDANSSMFTENVIKELERNSVPNANKSTLIIHAIQRDIPNQTNSSNSSDKSVVKHIKRLSDGSYNELTPKDLSQNTEETQSTLEKDSNSSMGEGQYGEERGRRKTRKGDIFTSIKRRFSKGRSQSVAAEDKEKTDKQLVINGDKSSGEATTTSTTFSRSVSADRQSLGSTRIGLGSARSSTSELSGISGFSTSTFVHEASTLVIECVENRIQKYYLVPPNLAESGKYKKKGKKLHIYNDHTFIAKHIPSGTICEICTLRLPFSIGKQGYQCRDCKMTCHKECHVRAPSYCPKTTIYDIELCSVKAIAETKPGVFSTLFRRKIVDESVNTNMRDDFTKKKEKGKKKTSIFRKVTMLGKIQEETSASRDQLTAVNTNNENETSAAPDHNNELKEAETINQENESCVVFHVENKNDPEFHSSSDVKNVTP